MVRLYLARGSGRRAIPRGRLPSYVVPQLVGGAVSAAYRWVRGKRLDFRAYLGPLKAGGARGLFANYRVTRQRPAAGARLRLGRGERPAKGGGGFRLTPLSVWGRQLAPAAPCTPPPGYKVIASSPQAVITSHEFQSDGVVPTIGWYGCLRAVGRMWQLTSATDDEGYDTRLGQVVLAGRFAALSFFYEDKYLECSSYVDLYDLGTRKGGQVYQTECSDPASGMPSGIDSLAVNSSGFAAWRATSIPVSPRYLNDVSCPSVSLCVAADNEGNVITSTNPTGGASAWTVTNLDYGNNISAVTCPSTSLCVATDSDGDVITSTNPTGGAAAWTVTHVDKNNGINAVTCASTSLCVATDDDGDVITSTNPTGGPAAWTLTHVDKNKSINAVTCPSTSLCVATDSAGDVITSTNPTGGAAAWTVTHVGTGHLESINAVTCPSTSLCVAADDGGNVIASTNPTGGSAAWAVTFDTGRVFDSINAVTCPSTSLCVAFDTFGDVITSTNPTGGPAAWNVTFNTGLFVGMNAVTCPSTSLCIATDNSGSVITSTNPAAGASSWSSDVIDADPSCVATPCPLDELYAHDNDGTRLIDITPTGGLGNVKLSGALLTWTHDGTPQQLTLH